MYGESPGDFTAKEPPEWVKEWMGRRRRGTSKEKVTTEEEEKRISAVVATEVNAVTPTLSATESERRLKLIQKRREDARDRLLAGLLEMEIWISDQLRLGLSGLLGDTAGQCRRIAARLIDAGATSLAGRVDEFSAKLQQLPSEMRAASMVIELGKWVLISRRFRMDPDASEIRSELVRAMSRDELLQDNTTLHVNSQWEVVGEQVTTQRDGLVRHSTWLRNLIGIKPWFSLLLDFYPATNGKRSMSFVAGMQFEATLAFFPAFYPLRAIIVERRDDIQTPMCWPESPRDPYAIIHEFLKFSPWASSIPLCLPKGRIGIGEQGRVYWHSLQTSCEFPLDEMPPLALLGTNLDKAIICWEGCRGHLLAAETPLGKYHAHE